MFVTIERKANKVLKQGRKTAGLRSFVANYSLLILRLLRRALGAL